MYYIHYYVSARAKKPANPSPMGPFTKVHAQERIEGLEKSGYTVKVYQLVPAEVSEIEETMTKKVIV